MKIKYLKPSLGKNLGPNPPSQLEKAEYFSDSHPRDLERDLVGEDEPLLGREWESGAELASSGRALLQLNEAISAKLFWV